MASRLLSLRIDDEVMSELEAQAREGGEPKSRLAQRLIEEGLRMKTHPGIQFRDGPTGRRAAVVGGPDVWQIIPVVNSDASGEEAASAIVELMDLTPAQARAALDYYSAFPDEIDARIRRNDELAQRLEAAWLRAQTANGR